MAHSSDQSPEIITSSPSIRPWSFNKGHSWRGRYLLLILCIVIIIAMVIGTIFVAHHYYHEWGGQGFLKARNTDGRKKSNNSYSSLPLRRVMARGAPGVHTSEHARGTEMHSVPSFYSCGDQQNSCEAYGLPYMCCPVGMSCHSTTYTTSGTFCCNSNATEFDCQPSAAKPPRCPASSFECAAVVGGGCCLNGTACSENGCIEFEGSWTPLPVTSTFTTTITHTTVLKTTQSSSASELTQSGGGQILATVTSTVTMVMGGPTTPTATTYKFGEEAQKAEGVSSIKEPWHMLHFGYSPIVMLVILALGRALL